MLEAYAGEDTWRDGIRSYIQRASLRQHHQRRPVARGRGGRRARPGRHRPRLHAPAGRPAGPRRGRLPRGHDRAQPDARRVQPRPQGRDRREPAALARAAADPGRARRARAARARGQRDARAARLRPGGRQRRPARLLPHALFAGDGLGAGRGAAGPRADRPARAAARRLRARRGRDTSRPARRSTCSPRCRGDANPIVAQGAVARWDRVHDVALEAAKPEVAALARDRWLPRLQQLGFDPKPGESLVDTDLRGDLLRVLGRMGDRPSPPRRAAGSPRSPPTRSRSTGRSRPPGSASSRATRPRPNGTGSPSSPRTRRARSSGRPISRCSARRRTRRWRRRRSISR